MSAISGSFFHRAEDGAKIGQTPPASIADDGRFPLKV